MQWWTDFIKMASNLPEWTWAAAAGGVCLLLLLPTLLMGGNLRRLRAIVRNARKGKTVELPEFESVRTRASWKLIRHTVYAAVAFLFGLLLTELNRTVAPATALLTFAATVVGTCIILVVGQWVRSSNYRKLNRLCELKAAEEEAASFTLPASVTAAAAPKSLLETPPVAESPSMQVKVQIERLLDNADDDLLSAFEETDEDDPVAAARAEALRQDAQQPSPQKLDDWTQTFETESVSDSEEIGEDIDEKTSEEEEIEDTQEDTLEAERIEQERLEQERAEQERLEQERIESERAEQERLEQERAEQERVEQERIEAERAEQERLEMERVKQERIEAERTAREDADRLAAQESERREREKREQRAREERERALAEQRRQEQERARMQQQQSARPSAPVPPPGQMSPMDRMERARRMAEQARAAAQARQAAVRPASAPEPFTPPAAEQRAPEQPSASVPTQPAAQTPPAAPEYAPPAAPSPAPRAMSEDVEMICRRVDEVVAKGASKEERAEITIQLQKIRQVSHTPEENARLREAVGKFLRASH